MNECLMCQMRWSDLLQSEHLHHFHSKEHLRLNLDLPSTPQVIASEAFGFKYWTNQ